MKIDNMFPNMLPGQLILAPEGELLFHPVDRPSHYNRKGIEAIDAIEASMSDDQFIGYAKGNCLKYLWRFEYKNGLEDLKKAQWYLNRLIEAYEKRTKTS